MFFRGHGPMPEAVTQRIIRPAIHSNRTHRELAQLVEAVVEVREAASRVALISAGGMCLGVNAIRLQSRRIRGPRLRADVPDASRPVRRSRQDAGSVGTKRRRANAIVVSVQSDRLSCAVGVPHEGCAATRSDDHAGPIRAEQCARETTTRLSAGS